MKLKDYIIFSIILLISLFLLSIKSGYTYYSWHDIITKNTSDLLLRLRFESSVTAMIVGGGLAIAGLILQTLFRNPLAGPSILGISSFSSLSIALFYFVHQFFFINIIHLNKFNFDLIVLFISLIGAILCLMLLLVFRKNQQYLSNLLIIGMMIAAFCNGIIYLLENILNKENLQSLTIWHFGSYRNLNANQIILMLCIIFCCAIIIYLQSSKYNTYLLGDLYAEGLGLPIKKFLIQNLLITAIITATITAFCGPIGFIGLAVPHIAKILFKTNNHRILIPLTILAGVNISLCCHAISSLSIFGTNLPINAITSLIGAPITIWLILKLNNNYA